MFAWTELRPDVWSSRGPADQGNPGRVDFREAGKGGVWKPPAQRWKESVALDGDQIENTKSTPSHPPSKYDLGESNKGAGFQHTVGIL